MEKEGGREERREKDRRTVVIKAARVLTIYRLSSPGITGCWTEPLGLLCDVGAVGCLAMWIILGLGIFETHYLTHWPMTLT